MLIPSPRCHEENITIQTQRRQVALSGTGRQRVRRRRMTPAPDYAWTDLLNTHKEQGIRIDSETAATRWRGERMDYGLAIPGSIAASRPLPVRRSSARLQNVSAETSDLEHEIEHDAEWHRCDEKDRFHDRNQEKEHAR